MNIEINPDSNTYYNKSKDITIVDASNYAYLKNVNVYKDNENSEIVIYSDVISGYEYDGPKVFNYNHKNFIIVYKYIDHTTNSEGKEEEIIKNGYLDDEKDIYLISLEEHHEPTYYFTYEAPQLGTSYTTYQQYFGQVEEVENGAYIGRNIPMYDLVLSETNIKPNSVKFDKITDAIYNIDIPADEKEETNENNGEWIITDSYVFPETIIKNSDEKELGKDLENIENIISSYTLFSYESLINKINSTTYIVNEFTYYVPKCVYYEIKDGENSYHSNLPVSNIEHTSDIKISIYSEDDKVYLKHVSEDNEGNVITENFISISYIFSENQYEIYRQIKNDDGELIENDKYGSYINPNTDGDYKLYIGNINFNESFSSNCYVTFTYDYIDENYKIQSSYLYNIGSNHDNEVAKYLNLFYYENDILQKAEFKINSPKDYYPLFSYFSVVKNELVKLDCDLTYTQFLNSLKTSSNISEFYLLSEYDCDYIYKFASDDIKYVSKPVYPMPGIQSTLSYFSKEENSYVKYTNNVVFNFENLTLGCSEDLNSDYFGIEAREINIHKKLEDNSNDNKPEIKTNFTYKVNPNYISNDTYLVYDGYEYVKPLTSYTYNNGNITEKTVRDGYWKKKYKEEPNPLVTISYSYSGNPLEISKNNISPTFHEEILGFINNHEVSYYNYEDKFVETYTYSYYNENNEECTLIPAPGTIFVSTDENELLFNVYERQNDGKYDEKKNVFKKSLVSKEKVLEKHVVQKEELKPITAYVPSSFGIANKKTVNITDITYVPASYIEVLTVDKTTGNYTYEKQLKHDGYFSYSYEVVDIPLKTETYVYNSNPLTIDKFDTLIDRIEELKNSSEKSIESQGNFNDDMLRTIKTIANNTDTSSALSYLSILSSNHSSKLYEGLTKSSEIISNSSYKLFSRVEDLLDTQNSYLKKLDNSNIQSYAISKFGDLFEKQIDALYSISNKLDYLTGEKTASISTLSVGGSLPGISLGTTTQFGGNTSSNVTGHSANSVVNENNGPMPGQIIIDSGSSTSENSNSSSNNNTGGQILVSSGGGSTSHSSDSNSNTPGQIFVSSGNGSTSHSSDNTNPPGQIIVSSGNGSTSHSSDNNSSSPGQILVSSGNGSTSHSSGSNSNTPGQIIVSSGNGSTSHSSGSNTTSPGQILVSSGNSSTSHSTSSTVTPSGDVVVENKIELNTNELNLKEKNDFIIEVSKNLYCNTNFMLSSIAPKEYAKQAIYRANILWEELKASGVTKK